MKIIVDELPKNSKECLFAEYIQMTSKYKCMFQHGMYSRCVLDCGEKCPYVIARNNCLGMHTIPVI